MLPRRRMAAPNADRPRELVVAGHVNVDRFLGLPTFPPDDRTVPVLSHREELGGTAGNLARVAAGYGVTTGLVARIGGDFPPRFWDELVRAGIDLRGIERVPAAPTPAAYILEDRRGGQRTLMDQGAMDRAPSSVPARPWLAEYSWVHLTTGPPAYQLALARQARARGLRVAADPAQEIHYRWDRHQLRALLACSEVLFGNRSEIARAVEMLGVRRVGGLLARVPLVIRTESRGGATAFARGRTVHAPAVRPRRVRTVVGAGDAFRGGFYAAWFAGRDLADGLRAGSRAAARWMEGAR
jgi:sugar/nucleoside kinase (ribokinase family)